GGVQWGSLVPVVVLIAVSSTFLCGLFVPVAALPLWLRPLSYALPLTYGADILHRSISGSGTMPTALSFAALSAFCLLLFAVSLRNIRRKWIV
ncbi:MAG: ABC transporter permease, partial [Spirochaetia bacterium]